MYKRHSPVKQLDNHESAYTDGSCDWQNKRCGGWGYVHIDDADTVVREDCYGEWETTNNRMEIMAALEALLYLNRYYNNNQKKFAIYTDSMYVKDGLTKWMWGWKSRGWISRTGDEVRNRDLWERMIDLYKIHRPPVIWVKGHNGNKYNEMADKLAAKGRRMVQEGKERVYLDEVVDETPDDELLYESEGNWDLEEFDSDEILVG